MDGKSLPGRAHRANVVHKLLVLHETATTEVTGARVPLNCRLLLWESCFPCVSRSAFNKSSLSVVTCWGGGASSLTEGGRSEGGMRDLRTRERPAGER